MIRSAIFGGTFDPPHLGHLSMARAAIETLGLDELLWMVTPDPPHKTDVQKSGFQQRLDMCRLCAADVTHVVVSDFENQRPGPHYTSDTITLLKNVYPDRSFSLLVGGDSLKDLHHWHDPLQILTNIEFLGVFSRGDQEQELAVFKRNFPGFSPKLVWIKAGPIAISSSQIRAAISAGNDASDHLEPLVLNYILNNKLYQKDQDVIAAAK